MSKARQLAQKPSQPTGRKNLIINGAQVIDQRNDGSSVTITSNDTFITDRFAAAMPSNGGSKMSVQQVSEAPEDFEYSLKVTSLTADTVAAGDFYAINQWIEGQNCSFLNWGSSNAKTVTLSFYVRSSLTGTFGGALHNSDRTRAYPFTYTISSANTWERKTITISGDTSGTWLTSNGRGIGVVWGISVGSTYLGTAGAWVGANIWSVSSTTSVLETDDATWQITGVQLEVGSTATEFEHRSYAEELALCQRYFECSYNEGPPSDWTGDHYYDGIYIGNPGENAQVYISGVPFKITKRTTNPTVTIYSKTGTSGLVTEGATDRTVHAVIDNEDHINRVQTTVTTGNGVFLIYDADAEL